MKVMKGIMLGTLITAGAVMLYTESTKNNKTTAISNTRIIGSNVIRFLIFHHGFDR